MFDLKNEWSISFAGCGFMGIYYVGATSCILERIPGFIQNADKIYGASAGSLMAVVLSVGIPLEKCCADLMFMAKEARKHKLGPLHPAYNLLQIVKDSLQRSLPEDAHVRASGKLCVSLTRVSDGKNVIVSEFDSRDELIQALVCSCFVPFYCGVVPPTYRGVHYVDGAVSDNLPRCHLKNTITFSAYAGESDVCPRGGGTLSFHEVRFNNVSIQVNSENLCRVASTFFPPEPEVMAEICQNGYVDALRFLQENNLISSECLLRSLKADAPEHSCCELVKGAAESEGACQDRHWWLDPQRVERLPVNLRKALCDACRRTHAAGGLLSQVSELLPDTVTSYLRMSCALPVESAVSLAQRLVDWIPDVPRDMNWFYSMAGDVYNKAWNVKMVDYESGMSLRRYASMPSGLNVWSTTKDMNDPPLTPETSPTSSFTFTWSANSQSDTLPPTPPATPTTESPKSAGGGWGLGLGRAVGWIQHVASEQGSNVKRSEDPSSFSAFK